MRVRRYAARLLALIALAAVPVSVWYVVNYTQKPKKCSSDPFPTKEFRKDVRKLRASGDKSGKLEPRARELARRAVECEEVVGRNEPSLRQLLGKPTRRKTVAGSNPHDNWTWVVGGGKPPPALLVQVVTGQAGYAEAPGKDDGQSPLKRGKPVD